jgi:hypothetical protein
MATEKVSECSIHVLGGLMTGRTEGNLTEGKMDVRNRFVQWPHALLNFESDIEARVGEMERDSAAAEMYQLHQLASLRLCF